MKAAQKKPLPDQKHPGGRPKGKPSQRLRIPVRIPVRCISCGTVLEEVLFWNWAAAVAAVSDRLHGTCPHCGRPLNSDGTCHFKPK